MGSDWAPDSTPAAELWGAGVAVTEGSGLGRSVTEGLGTDGPDTDGLGTDGPDTDDGGKKLDGTGVMAGEQRTGHRAPRGSQPMRHRD
ncbi:hypothetical protein PROH_04930 [Prochlorothrix hollandica PCC 9006 = CALU 1027]|uniref:Uncharacterized protein n=1 Tax=Prochlorothrix hollandica PCC 9006 = CALU 1027 TaxID=317619 RepID=A0A0M2Q005_PROHO|nr:hypothetical protein PROH_04930 [Prochlorothrix hollandica PCC 9006 = CALU 1027]